MLAQAAQKLGMIVYAQFGERECTAVDPGGADAGTLILAENNDFTKRVLSEMTKGETSYLCRVDRIIEDGDKLIVMSSDIGDKPEPQSIHGAYAACCAAMVLKTMGAVHCDIASSVRQQNGRYKVYGLDRLCPYTEQGEAEEIKAISSLCGINGGINNLEALREALAVYIDRWGTAKRRAQAADDVRRMLLSSESFASEWSSLEYINAGAYGFIYKAISAMDGKSYALKVINVGDDMEKIWRAKRESSNASQFYGSDYIVKTFDDGKVNTCGSRFIWMSMELLESVPCEMHDEYTVARLACDVCRALEEIHRDSGMAHRDVKPGNILRGEKNWKLCDFGISKEVQGRELATVIGTSDYMAPELLAAAVSNSEKTSYNNTVDIYALGMTMYTLLNRGALPFMPVPPYAATAAAQKESKIRRINGEQFPRAMNCSEDLMCIINKACAHKPNARFRSASQMREALEDFLDG